MSASRALDSNTGPLPRLEVHGQWLVESVGANVWLRGVSS